MTCPKCGSANIMVSAVNEFDLLDKHHGCLWWLVIGWWWIPIKWFLFTGFALIVKIFVPKKQRIITKQKTVCVCQNCGDRWTLNRPLNITDDTPTHSNGTNYSSHSLDPSTNLTWKMEDEIEHFEKQIKKAGNPMAEYEAIEAYFDYLKVGSEYYSDISAAAGQYFNQKYANSNTTLFYKERLEELKQQLHK